MYSSYTTLAESTESGVISFDADGFSVGSASGFNLSGASHVAWCWKAGGAAVSNTDGTITSQVSANQTAGFSIVSYTGNGILGATIGHGLNKKPSIVIIRNRDTAGTDWGYLTDVIDGSNVFSYLNTTNAFGSSSTVFTSDTFSVGSGNNGNENTKRLIAYCWAEIEGFSKFGSYVGNLNADGPFVYCGFKPAWVMIKRTDDTSNWNIRDSSRNSTNPTNLYLLANLNDPEGVTSSEIDFLSNGFKIRNTSTAFNASGGTYIFAAFAESPFTTANAK